MKTGKRSEFIIIIIDHVRTIATVSAMCAIITIMIAQYISVAVDMRTLLDRKMFSFSSNGQVAAHRVTGLIIKRLCFYYAMFVALGCTADMYLFANCI